MSVRVSCVIAAYNEERLICGVIEAVRRVPQVDEIVVVSDGSTDATADAAAGAGADRVVMLPGNLGKGGAVLAGARRASGRILLLIDADLEHVKPCELSALIGPVLCKDCDMAVGVLASDLVQTVLPHLSGIRVVRRDALLDRPQLATTRFGFERALTELARREGWTIARVPFTGVNHPRKEEKYGLIHGWQGKVKMTIDVLGLRRKRRHGAVRLRRTRVFALTSLVLMTAYLGMGFFSAASAIGSAIEPFPEPTAADRYLIIAAHADDELLAAGGLIQRALAAGAEVWVAFGTNGDGNRLAAALGSRRLLPRAADFIAEGETRQQEAIHALGRLGMPTERILFLGYPDRGLMALAAQRRTPGKPYVSPFTKTSASPYRLAFRPRAAYTAEDLARDVQTVVMLVQPSVVLTHHESDRHGDHRALNLFVRRAIRSVAWDEQARPRVYAYLVHAWDFPRPLRYAPNAALLPPNSLRESHHWLRFDLTPDELAAKQAALQDYRSQLDSPYLRLLLSSFLRQNELFAVTEP
ncbi:MAG: PIG-L family deacetylase [Armatimonadota bacterium]